MAKVTSEDPTLEIAFTVVDARGPNAALCVRLTGSLTVPHVFFQTEYIGDCATTCALAEHAGECNLIMDKLRALGRQPKPSPPFPPPCDAQMVKVTESLAVSSQPTPAQLARLGEFGIRSVVNLVNTDEAAYVSDERDLLGGVEYAHVPLVESSSTLLEDVGALRRALAAVVVAVKPVLVHDDTGVRAGLVGVLAAAKELSMANDATPDQICRWGALMGLDLKSVADIGARALRGSSAT